MYISQITARGANNEIGKGNHLPWHLPIDTKWFFDTVKGHPIIMGRKSMEGLGAALPENINIVISRHPIDAEHHYAFDFTIWERIKIM